MKWLTVLENHNLSFNIHILQKNDCIFMLNTRNNDQIALILEGFIQISQVYTNGENICRGLLFKNDVFISISSKLTRKTNYCYKAVAVIKTAVVTVSVDELNKKTTHKSKPFNIYKALYSNNEIIDILSHKNTKKRLVQLLLVLVKRFGQLKQHNIIIPFYLSHYRIATIIGSQRTTINRIMSQLKRSQIIHYTSEKIIINSLLQLIQVQK